MSYSPAPIWRERKMRLWQEKPELIFVNQVPSMVTWGRRKIPVELLSVRGRQMFGLGSIPVEKPVRVPILENIGVILK